MPELDQAHTVYQATVRGRLTDFPPNQWEWSKIDSQPPKHKLRYDAELVFWLLLWWATHALPVEDAGFPNHKQIGRNICNDLTSGNMKTMAGAALFHASLKTSFIRSMSH